MEIKDILDYVTGIPRNHNINVLKTMLETLIKEYSIGDIGSVGVENILKYVELTPHNSNVNVLKTMLEGLINPGPVVESEAYAVFDSADGSLTFFRDDEGKYTQGQTEDTKTYYTGIETDTYTKATEPPWSAVRGDITSVEITDVFKPISLNFLFCGMSRCVKNGNVNITGLNKIDMSNCTSMRNTFGAIVNRDILDTQFDLTMLDTSNVTDMAGCFSSFFAKPIISNWDTNNVTDMSGMFDSCMAAELDISSFDTSKVTDMRWMFTASEGSVTIPDGTKYNLKSRLTKIYVGDGFTTEQVTQSDRMFVNAKVLVGGNGTVYDPDHTDKEYARIDTASTPGYLTAKTE